MADEVSRRLGSPRRLAADGTIGVTAAAHGATLLTRNARDFAGIPDLRLDRGPPKTPCDVLTRPLGPNLGSRFARASSRSRSLVALLLGMTGRRLFGKGGVNASRDDRRGTVDWLPARNGQPTVGSCAVPHAAIPPTTLVTREKPARSRRLVAMEER